APAWLETNVGDVDKGLASAALTLSQTYSFHYNAHVPIGPSCAVADVTPNGAVVYSSTQSNYGQRTSVAKVTGLPENLIRVRVFEGSGTYGSAPKDECAQAAAIMSQ